MTKEDFLDAAKKGKAAVLALVHKLGLDESSFPAETQYAGTSYTCIVADCGDTITATVTGKCSDCPFPCSFWAKEL